MQPPWDGAVGIISRLRPSTQPVGICVPCVPASRDPSQVRTGPGLGLREGGEGAKARPAHVVVRDPEWWFSLRASQSSNTEPPGAALTVPRSPPQSALGRLPR